MPAKLIEFNNVSKQYIMGEVKIDALKNVSFTINEGELAIILGASGAGKTTVLNLLGGMDRATVEAYSWKIMTLLNITNQN